jgi:hypothetical protein
MRRALEGRARVWRCTAMRFMPSMNVRPRRLASAVALIPILGAFSVNVVYRTA